MANNIINYQYSVSNNSVVFQEQNPKTKVAITKTFLQRVPARLRQNIDNWLSALKKAEDTVNPDFYWLYGVYRDIQLDLHLSSVMQTRKIRVTGAEFQFVPIDSEVPFKTKIGKTKWFGSILSYAMDSLFWGVSLMQINKEKTGKIKVVDYPKYQLNPSLGRFYPDGYNRTNYLDYRTLIEDNQTNIFEVRSENNLGLLYKIAPVTIWKKNAQGFWAEFCEVYGMPMRIVKTGEVEDNLREEKLEMLKQMGASASAVIGMDEEIELSEAQNTTGDIYDKLIDRVNSEISKAVLGQTMTTDNGSSKSQADVHESMLDKLTESDKTFIEQVINEDVMPILVMLNILPEGLVFEFVNKIEISDTEANRDIALLSHYDIDEKFMSKKYGMPLKKKASTGGATTAKKPLQRELQNKRSNTCAHHHSDNIKALSEAEIKELDTIIDDLIKTLYDVEEAAQNQLLFEFTLKYLSGGMQMAFEDYGALYEKLQKEFENNLFKFSGAKTLAMQEDMLKMLFDDKGKKVSFAKFKAASVKISTEYNFDWLKTEYETSIKQASSGVKWKELTGDGVVMLKYKAVQDGRTRPKHYAMNGITLPSDHDFWKKYTPLNGWACRCSVIKTNSKKTTQQDKLDTLPLPDDGFDFNPGIEGRIFSESHVYFEKAKKA